MHTFMLVPITSGTGLSSVCLGVSYALQQQGIKTFLFRPIGSVRPWSAEGEQEDYTVCQTIMSFREAQKLASQGRMDDLLEQIIARWQLLSKQYDVCVIEGLVPDPDEEYVDELNQKLLNTINCDLILVTAQLHFNAAQWNEHIELGASLFGGIRNPKVAGLIINKLDNEHQKNHNRRAVSDPVDPSESLPLLKSGDLRCLAKIPWDCSFVAPRLSDLIHEIKGTKLNSEGDSTRRITAIHCVSSNIEHTLPLIQSGTLLLTPGDRSDVLLACALAEKNGAVPAGIILCGEDQVNKWVMEFCKSALAAGLPFIKTPYAAFEAMSILQQTGNEIPQNDTERVEFIKHSIAAHIDAVWLAERSQKTQEVFLSPPAFKYQLLTRAQAASKRIVLPEGDEARTLEAALICVEKKIAHCILLGDPKSISAKCQAMGKSGLLEQLEIIDPELVRERYIEPMVTLRKHKGLTPAVAKNQLEDNVVLGTMMLALDHVDGLVSGAVHTTANTIRPALQLIKTVPGCSLVSSVFFMLLPNQAVVYGDCAVNPDPSAEQLADIAIQSGATARAFGIDPKIAMISYATGTSGVGADVEKVALAVSLAKAKAPELLIDGPLQYDAAAVLAVGQSKAPESTVAGHANVFIFPDLNTGNTTYKAVQRSAHILSVGPVLQGLQKPVNDLSRGAKVDDIVYTIAITAIQAQ